MGRVVVVATVLVLMACGADEAPVAAEDEAVHSRLKEVELDRAAVAAQERIWLAARPAAYEYEVATECECSLAGTFSLTVEGEEVLGVESLEADAEPYRMHSSPTLDRAFAMLDEPLALAEDGEISTGRASAVFDATYGYPTSFTVTGSDGLPSYHVEIRDFAPIDSAVIDRAPPGLALTISNQSFDDPDVGLAVTVDGEVVIERSFAVEGQHNFVGYLLPLGPGDHQLTVRADTGATHERVVTLGPERRHAFVGYWGGDSTSPEAFSVSESDRPFAFG